jgi:hypothetical protein
MVKLPMLFFHLHGRPSKTQGTGREKKPGQAITNLARGLKNGHPLAVLKA